MLVNLKKMVATTRPRRSVLSSRGCALRWQTSAHLDCSKRLPFCPTYQGTPQWALKKRQCNRHTVCLCSHHWFELPAIDNGDRHWVISKLWEVMTTATGSP